MQAANNFCRENFLSKPTLLMIQKIKDHILQSLDKAGVLRISAGGSSSTNQPMFRRGGTALIPESLNVNGQSLPLLSALIAAAVAPNFAIRTSEKSLRTSQDKVRLFVFVFVRGAQVLMVWSPTCRLARFTPRVSTRARTKRRPTSP